LVDRAIIAEGTDIWLEVQGVLDHTLNDTPGRVVLGASLI